MNPNDYLQLIGVILSGISSLGVVIATIILFIKKKTLSTTLLMIGSVLVVLFSIGSFIANRVAGNQSAEMLVKTISWSKLMGGFISLIFVVGLLIFVIKDFKRP